MRRDIDYYGVLGVPRNVTPEELKRRYRQLVRSHHPDIAADQEAAHQRFILIVEAYRTLADPALRRAYDAVQSAAPPPPPTMSEQVAEQIDDWFRHAIHRLEESDLVGAAAQCRKILAIDPNHAAAQALLGDVHARREEWDQALTWYSGAVTAAPRNANYARKLRGAAESGQKARAAAERRERAERHKQRAVEAMNARHEFGPYAVILAIAWLILVLVWLLTRNLTRGEGWPPLPPAMLLAAPVAGLAAGVGLGIARPRAEETRATLLLQLGLAAAALVQFYGAVVVYAVVALIRDKLTPPVTRAFALTFGLVLLFSLAGALTEPPAERVWLSAVAWAGNLVFPALLLGQAVGRAGLRTTA